LKKKYSYVAVAVVFSLLVASIIGSYKGDSWEEYSRFILYRIKGDSVPSTATEYVQKNGVPYVHYVAENGVPAITRFNATIVANYAVDYANKFINTNDSVYLTQFFNCIQFLTDSVTIQNNLYYYQFNWQQGWYPNIKPPFISSMANGRAIEAFVYAFTFTNNITYLSFAKKLLPVFFTEVNDNGVSYKINESAWWFEEIAKPNVPTPYILDGHIYALQGLYKFWRTTKNDSAKHLLTVGLNALKLRLPTYDAGNGEIFYDINKNKADKKYHKIITSQMHLLWQTTGDSTYLQYYQKWSKPMQVPYILRVVKEHNISGIALIVSLSLAIFIPLVLLYYFLYYKKTKSSSY
jgi:hypothetical protein